MNDITSEEKSVKQHRLDKLSSIAKYSIAILSGLIIIFPSTYTFIEPPYNFDSILVITLIAAVIAFLANCRVILLVDLQSGKYSLKALRTSAVGSFFTLLSLIFVFTYIGINVYADRTSSPSIVDLQIQPLTPKAHSLIQLLGKAKDQDSDLMSWQWCIFKQATNSKNANTDSNSIGLANVGSGDKSTVSCDGDMNKDYQLLSSLESTMRTAYWTPSHDGAYMVSVTASDGDTISIAKSIKFTVIK